MYPNYQYMPTMPNMVYVLTPVNLNISFRPFLFDIGIAQGTKYRKCIKRDHVLRLYKFAVVIILIKAHLLSHAVEITYNAYKWLIKSVFKWICFLFYFCDIF